MPAAAAASTTTPASSSSQTKAGKQRAADPEAAKLLQAAGQAAQLGLALAALLLLPAWLVCGYAPAQVVRLYCAYLLFFGLGSVRRVLLYGRLAQRGSDAQAATSVGRLLKVAAVVAIPAGHWLAVYDYCRTAGGSIAVALAARGGLLAAPARLLAVLLGTAGLLGGALNGAVGWTLVLFAVALNIWSAQALGPAYDRLVAPEELVTGGPYAYVRHPVYVSYLLLFAGSAVALGSLRAGFFLMAAASAYFGYRINLEEALLRSHFAEAHAMYCASVPARLVPGVI